GVAVLQGPGVPQPPSGNNGAAKFLTKAEPAPLASATVPSVRRVENCVSSIPRGAKSGLAGTAGAFGTVEILEVKVGRSIGLIAPGLVVPRLRDCASANGIAQTARRRSR